jgi:hypothetical protein
MFLPQFLFVLVLAVLLTALLAWGRGWGWSWPTLIWLFTVLLLGSWALGVWFRPVGPPVRNFYWLPFVVASMIVALLLAATMSAPRPPRYQSREELKGTEIRPLTPSEEKVQQQRAEQEAAFSMGLVFWLLILVTLLALAAHYLLPPAS